MHARFTRAYVGPSVVAHARVGPTPCGPLVATNTGPLVQPLAVPATMCQCGPCIARYMARVSTGPQYNSLRIVLEKLEKV